MIPKIHAKGHSFKGAAAYLLHDIDSDTSERVAWTSTKNLSVEDPEIAWRVMAATAMNANQLKERAGIKNTGRKSNAHVLHMTLSWHPDEREDLQPDTMLGAAEAAILMLGADDRQALIVCHDEKDHAHVHILINRVSPEDGRILSSSYERLKSSEWAQKYEEARGQVFCDERVVNNAARKRGEYVRGKPDMPRHLYEQAQRASNDNTADTKKVIEQQRTKDREVGKKNLATKQRHAQEWAGLENDHKKRVNDIRSEISTAIGKAKDGIRSDYRPQWMELHHEQQAELRAHEIREDTRMGRVSNAVRSIKFRALMQSDERKSAISEAFKAFSDEDLRLAGLKRNLETRSNALSNEQSEEEDRAAAEHKADQVEQLKANQQRYTTDRAGLVLGQSMDKAAQRAAWRTRGKQRNEAFGQEQTQESTPRSDQDALDKARILEAFRERTQGHTPDNQHEKDDSKDND